MHFDSRVAKKNKEIKIIKKFSIERVTYLLIVAIGENPILLLGMEEQAEHIEAEAVFLIRGAFICADQQTVLHLRVCQQHDLDQSVITSKQILSVKSSKSQIILVKTLYREVWTRATASPRQEM